MLKEGENKNMNVYTLGQKLEEVVISTHLRTAGCWMWLSEVGQRHIIICIYICI